MSITEANNVRVKGFKFYKSAANDVPQWVSLSGNIGSWYEYETIDVTLLAIDSDLTDVVNYNLISGTLPGTCTLNSSTGRITGNPAAVNEDTTYTFTIGATDGKVSINRQFNILVRNNIAPAWITPTGSLGTTYEMDAINYQVLASDSTGPHALVYSLVSGSLPTGSTLNVNTGAITGPAVAVGVNTTFTFTINVTDGIESIDREFSIGVTNNTQPVWQTAAGFLGDYNFGDVISHQLIAVDSDGLPQPVTYSIVAGSLPDGCIMDTSGNITGTAPDISTTTSYIFTVRATDSVDYSDRQFSIGVIGNAYLINNSLMLNGVDEYLTRTPLVQGNRKTWTFSTWVKRSKIGSVQNISDSSYSGTQYDDLDISNSDNLRFYSYMSGINIGLVTTRVFRDVGKFFHLLLAIDTTQSIDTNRVKLYINGLQETSFSSITYPAQNYDYWFCNNNVHDIGRQFDDSAYFDGYLSETYFIDGAALTPSSFGEFDLNTGEWKPKLAVLTGRKNYVNQITGTYTSSGTNPSYAVDGNISTYVTYSSATSHWWKIQYATSKIIRRFESYCENGGAYCTSVVISGSNNDSLYTTLGTYTPPSNGTYQYIIGWHGFDFENNTSYLYYKVTFNYSTSNNPYINTINLYECDTTGGVGYNGFYLNYEDASNLGNDVSGNNNDYTSVNITTSNQTIDTPTNNFCTWDILSSHDCLLSYGNLKGITPTGFTGHLRGTLGMSSGKWYWEIKPEDDTYVAMPGIVGQNVSQYNDGNYSNSALVYVGAGWVFKNTASGNFTDPPGADTNVIPITTTETLGFAFDADNWILYFYQSGVLQYTITGLTPDIYLPYCGDGGSTRRATVVANFGQRPFTYTPPTGFNALCTSNLTAPSIKDGDKYFDVVTYTGTGTARNITGLDFQPDFVWIKNRSQAYNHGLYDSVRGPGKTLISSSTDAEKNDITELISFNNNGFSLGTGTTNFTNRNAENYVAWCWKAGGSVVVNNDGTITSQVSANPTSGFSIVATTVPTSGIYTIGHGLNKAPAFIIWKSRAVNDWGVYHVSQGATKAALLNSTTAFGMSSAWNNTEPTSTVFSVSGWGAADYIAYCWSEIEGFSKFGSYTGSGTTDGPFIYCGFKPRWIMVKRTDVGSVENWHVIDTERNPYNLGSLGLIPNANYAEGGHWAVDINSNGFKQRTAGTGHNASGGTYIFAAFADAPINYTTAR